MGLERLRWRLTARVPMRALSVATATAIVFSALTTRTPAELRPFVGGPRDFVAVNAVTIDPGFSIFVGPALVQVVTRERLEFVLNPDSERVMRRPGAPRTTCCMNRFRERVVMNVSGGEHVGLEAGSRVWMMLQVRGAPYREKRSTFRGDFEFGLWPIESDRLLFASYHGWPAGLSNLEGAREPSWGPFILPTAGQGLLLFLGLPSEIESTLGSRVRTEPQPCGAWSDFTGRFRSREGDVEVPPGGVGTLRMGAQKCRIYLKEQRVWENGHCTHPPGSHTSVSMACTAAAPP